MKSTIFLNDGTHSLVKYPYSLQIQHPPMSLAPEEFLTLWEDVTLKLKVSMSLQVNVVCQHVRKNQRAMGGLQTIVFGDFYQLPPVPNAWTADPANYCFQSKLWPIIIPHKVILHEVVRQQNEEFIRAVSETARGCPSESTIHFINQLNQTRPRQTLLYSRRIDVQMANHDKLLQMEGELMTYTSSDNPNVSKKLRRSVDAPYILCLKVGAPVLLTINLSDTLVNGLIGSVTSMDTSSVTVYFQDIREEKIITPQQYFQVVGGKDVFVCSQIPLLLAFALTIHKCQGMTLSSVWVDCHGAFDAGQISVALGRVREEDDITVVNFRPGLCPPHPPIVNGFYGTPSTAVDPKLKCCQGMIDTSTRMDPSVNNLEPEDNIPQPDSDSDDESEDIMNMTFQMTSQETRPDPYTSSIINKLKINHPITTMHHDINTSLDNISAILLTNWISKLKDKLQTLKNQHTGNQQANTIVNAFLNAYGQSSEFHDDLKEVFSCPDINKTHLYIGVQILIKVQNKFFENDSDQPSTSVSETFEEPSPSGHPKLRYIAGMCVGRVLHRDTQFICRNILKMNPTVDHTKQRILQIRKHLYNSSTIAMNETSLPESLTEITSRQTKYGHLTIVSDSLFSVFIELQKFILPLLNSQRLKNEKCNLFVSILDETMEHLTNNIPLPDGLLPSHLRPVLIIFLKTCLKEMGGRLQKACKVKKKLAHRKQVLLEEHCKDGTNKRLKLSDSTASSTSAGPHDAHTTTELVDTVTTEKITYTCAMCKKEWSDTQRFLWIECTVCSSWLHRKCDSTLKSQKVWKKVSAEGAHYACPICTRKWSKTTYALRHPGTLGHWNARNMECYSRKITFSSERQIEVHGKWFGHILAARIAFLWDWGTAKHNWRNGISERRSMSFLTFIDKCIRINYTNITNT